MLTRRVMTPSPLQTPIQRPAICGTAGSSVSSRSLPTTPSPVSTGSVSATRVARAGLGRSDGASSDEDGDQSGPSPLVEHAAVDASAVASSRSRRFAQPIAGPSSTFSGCKANTMWLTPKELRT
jgi:hypothetical protein